MLDDSHNQTWPPRHWQREQKLIEEARQRLIGQVSDLAMFYNDARSSDYRTWRQRVASVMAGKADPEKPTGQERLHVPLPRQIARTSASLLFSDGFSFEYKAARAKDVEGQAPSLETVAARLAEEELQQLIDDEGWQAKLWQAAYVSSGEGGVYLLPAWYEGDVRPRLRAVHHNRGVPRFVGGKLIEATLWSVVEKETNGTIWRHLECYYGGHVQHGLYKGKSNLLGERVDLGAHGSTSGIQDADRDGVVDLARYSIEANELLCDYVPNLLPHPVSLDGNVGGSDTQGFEDQLYALDSADSGWESDVRVGKRRVIVSEDMLDRSGTRGGGASFDTEREVFVGLAHSPLEGVDPIRPIDFEIRADSFQTTVESRFSRCCTAAGYNPESVTWAESGQPMTATEVMSRDSLSRDTTNSKRRYFTPALEAQASKHLRIGKALGGITTDQTSPTLQWPQVDDGDQAATADLINTLALAGAISIYRRVQLANPEWDDTEIQEEVQRIREDQGLAAPAPPTPQEQTGEPEPDDLG